LSMLYSSSRRNVEEAADARVWNSWQRLIKKV
jgi:hypothetical protein